MAAATAASVIRRATLQDEKAFAVMAPLKPPTSGIKAETIEPTGSDDA